MTISRRLFLAGIGPVVVGLGCGDDDATGDAAIDAPPIGLPDGVATDTPPIDLPDGAVTDGAVTDASPPFADDTAPRFFGFRVSTEEPSKVIFDSNKPVTGSDPAGFVVSGKTITGLSLNSGSTTGHSLTVDSAFDFWDNNTIRYEGGSDVVDADSNRLHNFTLRYVENRIDEPSALTATRYVNATATGTGDGLSDETAWNVAQLTANTSSGMTVYVKSGDYGNQNIRIETGGTTAAPVKLIGYKTAINDIADMYYTYGVDTVLDPAEMPTFDNTSPNGVRGMIFSSGDYVIIRNFQSTEGRFNFLSNQTRGVIFDNCISKNTILTGSGFQHGGGAASNNRIINSISINAEMSCVTIQGDFSLIRDTKAYGDDVVQNPDYYVFVDGSNNIMTNVYAERLVDDGHGSHGIGVKTDLPGEAEYNLIENSSMIGGAVSFELRHSDVSYNVMRNCRFLAGLSAVEGWTNLAGGGTLRDGAHHNTIEGCTFEGLEEGITFRESREDTAGSASAEDNDIVNCTFKDLQNGIVAGLSSGATNGIANRNRFVHCTWDNVTGFLYADLRNLVGNGTNGMINCIFSNVPTRLSNNTAGMVETYSNYWGGFAMTEGVGNIAVDPGLDADLAPSNAALNVGTPLAAAKYDKMGTERNATTPTIGAMEIF